MKSIAIGDVFTHQLEKGRTDTSWRALVESLRGSMQEDNDD